MRPLLSRRRLAVLPSRGGGPRSLRAVVGRAPFAAAVAELGARGGAAARVSDPSDRLGEGVAHCPFFLSLALLMLLTLLPSSDPVKGAAASQIWEVEAGHTHLWRRWDRVSPSMRGRLDPARGGGGDRIQGRLQRRREDPGGAWVSGSDWARRRARETGSRGKPGSVAGGLASGLENGLAGGLLVFFIF